MHLRILFLDDLVRLFSVSHENRKIMLQQSVWQDWLLALGALKPTNDDEKTCQEKVYSLLNILLHHSIKWEWGGWRVWVDTMALIHSGVARVNHKEHLDQIYADDEKRLSERESPEGEQESENDESDSEVAEITQNTSPTARSRSNSEISQDGENSECHDVISESQDDIIQHVINDFIKSAIEISDAKSEPITNGIETEKTESEKDEKAEVRLEDVEGAEENNDNKLEKNDSETVEVGSKDGSVGQTANQASLSPTEELTAIAPSQQAPEEQVSWSPAPRTPGAFRFKKLNVENKFNFYKTTYFKILFI